MYTHDTLGDNGETVKYGEEGRPSGYDKGSFVGLKETQAGMMWTYAG